MRYMEKIKAFPKYYVVAQRRFYRTNGKYYACGSCAGDR